MKQDIPASPCANQLGMSTWRAQSGESGSPESWLALAERLPCGVFRLEMGEDGELLTRYANPCLLGIFGREAPVETSGEGQDYPGLVEAFLAGLGKERHDFELALSTALGAGEDFQWRGELVLPGELRVLKLSLWRDGPQGFSGLVEDQGAERRKAELNRLALFKLGELSGILAELQREAESRTRPVPSGRCDASWSGLSAREREVAKLVLEGHSNAELAARLGISVSTSKKHVNALFRKLGVKTRSELFALERRA